MGQTASILSHLLFGFVAEQLWADFPPVKADLTGRTYLITGSNTGLGLAAVVHLARLNPARLILAVRDLNKGAKAKEAVLAQTTYGGTIDVWELDMSSFESVKRFVDQANTSLTRLDGAIINAGVGPPDSWEVTVDGWERVLQVNAIATGLLCVLLLPLLQATIKQSQEPPHLTITGSESPWIAKFPEQRATNILEALNDPKCSLKDRYAVSKTFDQYIGRVIAKLPQAEGLIVNYVNPGLCLSDIGRNSKPPEGFARKLYWTSEKGAINLVYAAVKPTPSGAFIGCCDLRQPPPWTTTKKGLLLERKVWDEMLEVWKRVSPDSK
ncbi:hypothetical protein FB45DRAFT_1135210 [Roridomyces roridus]|uniref:NAD(P)-binding protein n=1 Tax=Roridomyces roridus TaxID=1738132 RepID=A0AAD7C624_9AGAR|nr:hypothetical protein FB45DRAFT_1135210 [Roridomyces roridus]